MNIEESIKEMKSLSPSEEAIETLLTAYEKEKEKTEYYEKIIINKKCEEEYKNLYQGIRKVVNKEYISKDKIKPIQIIDLDGKIHNVYKIEEE